MSLSNILHGIKNILSFFQIHSFHVFIYVFVCVKTLEQKFLCPTGITAPETLHQ